MLTVASIGGEEIQRSWQMAKHTLEVLGSEIEFFRETEADALWAIANATQDMPHLCLENWLSEPFRILFGQIIYPRLVERNLGNGSAHVSLRPSPSRLTNASTSIGSLLSSEAGVSTARFWELYRALLTMIATTRNDRGQPDFQSHRVTRFYEEIIQASQGSRWVWCLTLAGAAEGLAKLLMKPAERTSEFGEAELASIKKTIQEWEGDKNLKQRVLNDVSRLGDKSIGQSLHKLVECEALEKQHEAAWKAMRNKVMHGNLVLPWSTEEEDGQVVALAELVHNLTREIAGVRIQESAPEVPPSKSTLEENVRSDAGSNRSESISLHPACRPAADGCLESERNESGLGQGSVPHNRRRETHVRRAAAARDGNPVGPT